MVSIKVIAFRHCEGSESYTIVDLNASSRDAYETFETLDYYKCTQSTQIEMIYSDLDLARHK